MNLILNHRKKNNMKLIDKDKVVAEIKRRLSLISQNTNAYEEGRKRTYIAVLYLLDSLETKDVDLEKELERLDSLLYDLDGIAIAGTTSYLTVEDVKYIAKNFFELGLKTQKGE